ncbi:hypothetical protein ABZU76_46090 [Amycolatopsis sp. NPDC005232]|uniref:hypothetical protein n=1 Tax=Amycolatopsis sp. NPDC005232 TaxID=3157027 RepID=UPI0033AA0814
MTVNAYIEEEIFYPAAREAEPAVWILPGLTDLDGSDETFDAKVTVLAVTA